MFKGLMTRALFYLLAGLVAVQSHAGTDGSLSVKASKESVDKTVETVDGQRFRVISRDKIERFSFTEFFSSPDHTLVLGFPRSLVGERNVFGGVIVAVSARDNEDLGSLKLADIPPAHVRSVLSADEKVLNLMGCEVNCDERSKQEVLFSIPIINSDKDFYYLNISAFGSQLNFFKEAGEDSIIPEKTDVLGFEYNLSTLLFDVKNAFSIPISPEETLTFDITTRWYLKLSSGFSSNFNSRRPAPGVGYFQTTRNRRPLITRFSLETSPTEVAKYYIKNVPTEYRKAFADSFEDWNNKLRPILGKNFFTYEFLETTDARYENIIPGDIRYNVLEWDITNVAPYGGLGPSIASQTTGEIFSASTLVQGPRVVELYTKWWKISEDIKMMRHMGLNRAADETLMKYAFESSLNRPKAPQARLAMGRMQFVSHAADPRISDPSLDPADFLETPDGYTYETYMYGYFRDMVAHELGHNIGLRHNFKGNLGAEDSGHIRKVSRSIMEYLDREYRHLNHVGDYDVMAIAYGYLGNEPKTKDWFCTDENQPSSELFMLNAECTSSDASADPFDLLLGRLNRVIDFILLPGSELAPVWNVEILTGQITPIVTNLANYYVTAFQTAKDWTNFNNDKRKVNPSDAPRYILSRLAEVVCNPQYQEILNRKTPEGRAVAEANLKDFRVLFQKITAPYARPEPGFTAENFPCLAGL